MREPRLFRGARIAVFFSGSATYYIAKLLRLNSETGNATRRESHADC
jgi:hypothetical protein